MTDEMLAAHNAACAEIEAQNQAFRAWLIESGQAALDPDFVWEEGER